MQTRLILRALLLLTDLILVLMALYTLRQRRLPWFDTFAWVLVVFCLPYFGPFVCMLNRNKSQAIKNREKTAANEQFPGNKGP